jgi:hypothetical protein
MSRLDAEKLARLYDGFYVDQDQPRFLSSPPIQDGPEHVSPLRFVAGVAMLVIVAFVFGWVL